MNARCHRDAVGQQQPSNSGVSIVESIGFTLSCNACDTHKDGVCRESSVNAWWVAWAVMRVQKVAMIACQQGSSLEQPHTHVCKHAAAAQHRTITGLSFDAPAPNQPLWQQLHSLPWAPQLHGAECVCHGSPHLQLDDQLVLGVSDACSSTLRLIVPYTGLSFTYINPSMYIRRETDGAIELR